MNMKTLLVFLLVAVVAASATENFFWLDDFADERGELGKGCCLPAQWEGRVGAWHISKRFLRPRVRASDSKVGLDYTGKKVGVRSMFYCKKTRKVYETRTVADFNAKKAYFIFKDKCKTFQLKRQMRRPCIPDAFKQFKSYFYGAGSSSLSLSPYGYRNGSVEVFSVVTAGSCVPIKGAYRVKTGRFSSKMGSYQYYNITTGIRDQSLYNVPASCHKANATEVTAEGLKGGRKLWRKFQKFVGYNSEEETFNADSSLIELANDDPLTLTMDMIDGSADQVFEMRGHRHWRGRDRWVQRRWRARRHHRRED